MKTLGWIIAFTLLLSGCANRQPALYYWGDYEDLLYDMYVNPGEADPGVQVAKLTQDIQRAHSRGKMVAPGVHAHLGMMYTALGNLEQAQAAFVQEQTLYPESQVLVKGMMERAFADQKSYTKPQQGELK